MPIHERRDRRGRVRIYVDKQWPDGTRFRRVMPNRTRAKNTLARIEGSIATGTWPTTKESLERGRDPLEDPTIAEFTPLYLEYCRKQNRRPEFKKFALAPVVRVLGRLRVREVRRKHGHVFR